MTRIIDVLIIEDDEDDALLLTRAISEGDFELRTQRVQTEASLRAALAAKTWDVILSDYRLPGFDALVALKIVQETQLDIPFLVVSGAIGEETAVETMRNGAHDYIMKDNLSRVLPAMERELREAEVRRDHRRAEDERRLALIELSRTNRFIGAILDSIHGTVIYTRHAESGDVTYVSPGIERLTGYAPAEVMASKTLLRDGIHASDRDQNVRPAIVATTGALVSEYRFVTKSGATKWFRETTQKVTLSGDGHVSELGVMIDITERVLSEESTQRAQELLHHSNRMASLGEMAGTIAHEINNPMAIILGRARQLRDVASAPIPDPAMLMKFTKDLEDTAQRVVGIVRGMRTLSRKADQDPCSRTGADSLVRGTLAICSQRARYSDIQLVVDMPQNAVELDCRPSEISQVLVNLLGNAFDAVETLEDRWVRLAVREIDRNVEISVTDSGHGMPTEVREKALTPFFTTKAVGKGTGLGLSISRSIVEGHRGRLLIDDSSPNTRVVVVLPKVQVGT